MAARTHRAAAHIVKLSIVQYEVSKYYLRVEFCKLILDYLHRENKTPRVCRHGKS